MLQNFTYSLSILGHLVKDQDLDIMIVVMIADITMKTIVVIAETAVEMKDCSDNVEDRIPPQYSQHMVYSGTYVIPFHHG